MTKKNNCKHCERYSAKSDTCKKCKSDFPFRSAGKGGNPFSRKIEFNKRRK